MTVLCVPYSLDSDPERLGFEALDSVLEGQGALSSAARKSHEVNT